MHQQVAFNDRDIERVIDMWQDSLYSFAFYKTGDEGVAQDIVQEAFIKYYEHSQRKKVANVKSWLYRAVHNACIDHCRWKRSRHTTSLSQSAEVLSVPTDEPYTEFLRIETILQCLPDEQAEVVRMKCTAALRFTEIADILGISVNTVKSRYRYAVSKLRTKYKDIAFDEEDNI